MAFALPLWHQGCFTIMAWPLLYRPPFAWPGQAQAGPGPSRGALGGPVLGPVLGPGNAWRANYFTMYLQCVALQCVTHAKYFTKRLAKRLCLGYCLAMLTSKLNQAGQPEAQALALAPEPEIANSLPAVDAFFERASALCLTAGSLPNALQGALAGLPQGNRYDVELCQAFAYIGIGGPFEVAYLLCLAKAMLAQFGPHDLDAQALALNAKAVEAIGHAITACKPLLPLVDN